ncbi:uncharacterized protein LOC121684769 [Alosa sapidissima]|uniref:uncharacterized protein LOC121684769 n=1 Tax=Alosa sapidissima TaxID=34773 RepID=UPI001C096878|nr:uncharacterized protein LOC121684769 [Alosa sapidissima]
MTASLGAKLLKFADGTTDIGLIQDGDESPYRKVVEELVQWCSQNHLELNPKKTVEMTVDFRRSPPLSHPMPFRTTQCPRWIPLGSWDSQDLKWSLHINTIQKKAQQRLYFLRQLRKFNLELLTTFYSAIIQSVICTSITVWFGSAIKRGRARLQRTIRAAERIIGADLPSIQDLYRSRVSKRVEKSVQISHILVTNCSTSFPLVDDTGHWLPKPADTKQLLPPKQSLCCTLRNSPHPYTEQSQSTLFSSTSSP